MNYANVDQLDVLDHSYLVLAALTVRPRFARHYALEEPPRSAPLADCASSAVDTNVDRLGSLDHHTTTILGGGH